MQNVIMFWDFINLFKVILIFFKVLIKYLSCMFKIYMYSFSRETLVR
jgi:hypothetical protein